MNTSPPPLIPARMMNEVSYCPRLFHLEWVQREWVDNYFTEDGRRVHRNVDRPRTRVAPSAANLPESRSVDLSDEDLGFIAKIDFVEEGADGEVVPVEFKRGTVPRSGEVAEPEQVQLAVHGLLLEAHGQRVERGFVWFAGSRRRVEVPITASLRARVLTLRDEARRIASSDRCPPPLIDSPKCESCSLAPVCLPDEHNVLSNSSQATRSRAVRAAHELAMPLHVAESGSVVRKDGEELVIEPRTSDPVRARLIDVSSVVLHGASKVTTPALHALLKAGVDITYLSSGGWLYGRTSGPWHRNILVRIAQHRVAAHPERTLALAKRFVRAKITNCRVLLRRHGQKGAKEVSELSRCRDAVERSESLSTLLGLEGNAARVYFRGFARLLTEKQAGTEFNFEKRNRRPPTDPVNALLSFTYALLTTTWTETVSRVGLDPYLGFFHQPRYGRPALALDLMEEFRPIIADSVVLNLIRRGIVAPEDFIRTPTACGLSQSGRRRVIGAYERRLEEEITHPVFGYRASYRRTLELQARLLSRHLMGELDEFPEFTTR